MREVYVIGVGQTKFGKMPGISPIKLGVDAARAAIKDAGIDPRRLECVYASRSRDDTQTAENIMQFLGVAGLEMHNTENACASGGAAVNLLWKDIACGVHDVGIAIGCESMTSMPKGLVGVAEGDLNGTLGMTMIALAAMNAVRLMETRGATLEDLAYPSVKNHRNACLNPYAMYKKSLTAEDIINARTVSDPITVLHCCPITDGAAAVVLCTREIAMRYTTKLVKIAASNVLTAPFEAWDEDILQVTVLKNLAQLSYERAGIGPEDLDLVELHDAFAPEEIFMTSSMGLCRAGDEIAYMRSGAAEIGGKCPFNPSGGLQSLGHPLGCSGTRVVAEVAQHLRGDAGERQVKGAKCGMAQMVGGYLTGLSAPAVGAINILTI